MKVIMMTDLEGVAGVVSFQLNHMVMRNTMKLRRNC